MDNILEYFNNIVEFFKLNTMAILCLLDIQGCKVKKH